MIVNLIKRERMFNLNLPKKVKGRYWLEDIDSKGKNRKVLSVEAEHGEWVLKSNSLAYILGADGEYKSSAVVSAMCFLNLKYIDGTKEKENEIAFLFAEDVDESRRRYKKYVLPVSGLEVSFNIGREEDNNFFYNNRFVSGRHAKLTYAGNGNWSVIDLNSTNGTYVNGRRIESCSLSAGDVIYIMGLKLVVGYNFLAVNNPDNQLKIRSKSFAEYRAQEITVSREKVPEFFGQEFFFRPPRFHREIKKVELKIDSPPQPQKEDSVPMALMMGPSLTMGFTSLSTGLLTVNNVLTNGGNISQALPTMMMSVSMLLGTVLWPVLTKKYEKKQRIKNEHKRQKKYLTYLDQIRDDIKRECKLQSDILTENYITPDECVSRVVQCSSNLWERVIGQSDFLTLRLGIGRLPLEADVKYSEKKFTLEDDNLQDAMLALGTEPKILENVPVSISLTDNTVVGLYGEYDNTAAMLKSMILQMASLHSYDELKMVMIAEAGEDEEWNFVRFIPHFWNDDKTARFYATTIDEVRELSAYLEKTALFGKENDGSDYMDGVPCYVVIAVSKGLAEKCEFVQKMLQYKDHKGFSLLAVAGELRELPRETKLVVKASGEKSKVFDKNDTTGRVLNFRADSMKNISMRMIAENMAGIALDAGTRHYALPDMVTFLEMFQVGKIDHLNSLTRWKENNPTKTLQTPVGVGMSGETFFLDLHEKFHGPHGLVAGMTGSGKSEFIITYILSLAVNYHPDEVAFILIDYKGGGLTGAFEDDSKGIRLPHLAGTITNLDGAAVKRSLISIQSELRRRQAIFNEARKISNEGTMDIYKYQQLYRDNTVKEPVPHLFIISDEFAELKTQQPEFMEQLISAARIGRSLGVHLILATQKPSGVVDDQIWSNSKFRVCLKVQERADSQDMIKCPDAAELSQTGRFYLQVGFNELFALGQSAWCGAEYIPVELLVDIGAGVSANMTAHLFDAEGHELYSEEAELNAEDADALTNEYLFTTAEDIREFALSQGGDWTVYEEGKSVQLVKGVCLDWKLYPILRIKIEETTVLGKVIKKFGVSATLEILGSKTTLLKGHKDFPNNIANVMKADSPWGKLEELLGIGASCTYDYKPWDSAMDKIEDLEEKADEEQNGQFLNNEAIVEAKGLQLSAIRVFLKPGQSEQIQVTSLPAGYELSDLEVYSQNEKIAVFDIREGVITAGDETGDTQIVVKTKDGKHIVYCTVTVEENNIVEFNELYIASGMRGEQMYDLEAI